MREQVVALFQKEEDITEAARMLHAAGHAPSDLDLVSKKAVNDSHLLTLLRHVHLGKLMERPEGMWPCALRWAIIGSVVVEVPVLIWVLLAFDSWGIQLFLGLTLWKFGTIFGGILGAIAGANRGLESGVVHRYEKHFSQGAFALAARVKHCDAPQARGIFMESGAYDIRNLEGDFRAKKEPAAQKKSSSRKDGSPERRDSNP